MVNYFLENRFDWAQVVQNQSETAGNMRGRWIMRYELDGSPLPIHGVNVRAVLTIIAGLTIGVVFWSALFISLIR